MGAPEQCITWDTVLGSWRTKNVNTVSASRDLTCHPCIRRTGLRAKTANTTRAFLCPVIRGRARTLKACKVPGPGTHEGSASVCSCLAVTRHFVGTHSSQATLMLRSVCEVAEPQL